MATRRNNTASLSSRVISSILNSPGVTRKAAVLNPLITPRVTQTPTARTPTARTPVARAPAARTPVAAPTTRTPAAAPVARTPAAAPTSRTPAAAPTSRTPSPADQTNTTRATNLTSAIRTDQTSDAARSSAYRFNVLQTRPGEKVPYYEPIDLPAPFPPAPGYTYDRGVYRKINPTNPNDTTNVLTPAQAAEIPAFNVPVNQRYNLPTLRVNPAWQAPTVRDEGGRPLWSESGYLDRFEAPPGSGAPLPVLFGGGRQEEYEAWQRQQNQLRQLAANNPRGMAPPTLKDAAGNVIATLGDRFDPARNYTGSGPGWSPSDRNARNTNLTSEVTASPPPTANASATTQGGTRRSYGFNSENQPVLRDSTGKIFAVYARPYVNGPAQWIHSTTGEAPEPTIEYKTEGELEQMRRTNPAGYQEYLAAASAPRGYRRADLQQVIQGIAQRPSEQEGFRPPPTQWPIPRQGAMLDGMPPAETMNAETTAYFRRYPDVARMYLSNNFGLDPNQFADIYHRNFGSSSGLYGQEGRFWGTGEFTPETMGEAAYGAMRNRPLNLSDSYARLATPADRMAFTANPDQFSANMPRTTAEFTSDRFRVPEQVARASEQGVRRVTDTTDTTDTAAFTGALGRQTMSDATRAYFRANPDLVTEFNKESFGLNADQYAAQHFQLHGRAEGRTGTGLAAPAPGPAPGPAPAPATNLTSVVAGPGAAPPPVNQIRVTGTTPSPAPAPGPAPGPAPAPVTQNRITVTGTPVAAPPPPRTPVPAPPPGAPAPAPTTLTSTITPTVSTANPRLVGGDSSRNTVLGTIAGAGTQWLLNQLSGNRPPPAANRPPAGAPPAANRPPAGPPPTGNRPVVGPPPAATQAPAPQAAPPTSVLPGPGATPVDLTEADTFALPTPAPGPAPTPAPAPAPLSLQEDEMYGRDMVVTPPPPAPYISDSFADNRGLGTIQEQLVGPPPVAAAPSVDLDLLGGADVLSSPGADTRGLNQIIMAEAPIAAPAPAPSGYSYLLGDLPDLSGYDVGPMPLGQQTFDTFGADADFGAGPQPDTTGGAGWVSGEELPTGGAEEPALYTDGRGNYYDANGRFLYSTGDYDTYNFFPDYTASSMPSNVDYGDFIGGYDYGGYDDVDYGGYFKDGGFVNLLYKDGGGVKNMATGGWIDLGNGTSAILGEEGLYEVYDNETGNFLDYTTFPSGEYSYAQPLGEEFIITSYVPGEEVYNYGAQDVSTDDAYREYLDDILRSAGFQNPEEMSDDDYRSYLDAVIAEAGLDDLTGPELEAELGRYYGVAPIEERTSREVFGPPAPVGTPPPVGAPPPVRTNINPNLGRIDMGNGTFGEAEEGGTFSVYDERGRFLYTLNSNNEIVAAGNPTDGAIVRYNPDGTSTVQYVDQQNYPGGPADTTRDRTGDQGGGVLDAIRQLLGGGGGGAGGTGTGGMGGLIGAGVLGGLLTNLLDRNTETTGGYNQGVDMAELSRMQQGPGTGVQIGQYRGPANVYVPYEQYAYWNPQNREQLYNDLGVSGYPRGGFDSPQDETGMGDAIPFDEGYGPNPQFTDPQGNPLSPDEVEGMGPPAPDTVPFEGQAYAEGGTTHFTYGTPVRPEDNLGMKRGGLSQAHTVHSHHTNPLVNGRIDFRHGSSVNGAGDGQSDDIPAMLADGEYVIDAETVAQLGNGSNKAGAQVLDKFREAIRAHKRKAPLDKIPPASKSPLAYLKEAMKNA